MNPYPLLSLNHLTVPVAMETPPSPNSRTGKEAHRHRRKPDSLWNCERNEASSRSTSCGGRRLFFHLGLLAFPPERHPCGGPDGDREPVHADDIRLQPEQEHGRERRGDPRLLPE